jgi:diguanylate cyclase (GGDEF)-like protein
MRCTIGRKLALGFSVVFAFIVLAACFSAYKLNQLATTQRIVNNLRITVLTATWDLRSSNNRLSADLSNYVLAAGEDPMKAAKIRKDWTAIWERAEKAAATLTMISKVFGAADAEKVARLRLLLPEYRHAQQAGLEVIDRRGAAGIKDALEVARTQVNPKALEVGALAMDLDNSATELMQSSIQKMDAAREATILALILSTVVAIITGSVLVFLAARWIEAPIVDLASVMQNVSRSRNYSLRAIPRGQDEIGVLVAGFNQMLVEIERRQSLLEDQAVTDELTGLPNRRLLADRLAHALSGAEREQSMLALLYLDLDGFKLVNDTLGHSAGDFLLQEVAGRLQRRTRASDTLARIGGDEFTVLASHIRNTEEAELVARELLAQLETPFALNGHKITLTASMGISLYPGDALDPEQLIQHADTAMYVAKSSGKNRYKVFSAEFGDVVRERLELENQLRGAVERGELAVHYQPEFDLATHRLRRFEALARWQHPTLGMIPPSKFIPIAEETGLISQIGLWVMEQACTEAVRWQGMAEYPVQVAVNVSTLQFFREDFVASVTAILTRTGLNPKLLQLELTESVFMPRLGNASKIMSELRHLGISIAVDDFGTGYSTLSYLPRLPLDCLKIDRSFLHQPSSDSRALIHSLVGLAHDLKMNVIIEGVETPEQLNLMRQIGCDEIQGFLFGRPTADPDQYLLKERDRQLEVHERHSEAAVDLGSTAQSSTAGTLVSNDSGQIWSKLQAKEAEG